MAAKPARVWADLLETRLSAREGVVLLERDRLSAVVEELELEGMANDPAKSIRAGKLLGADLVVWLGASTSASKRTLTVRLSAVKSGVVLLATEFPEPAGIDDPVLESLASRIAGARVKAGLDRKSLVPISMLNLRATVSNADTIALESALTEQLERALTDQPGLAVLERRRLSMLEFEKLLSWDLNHGHFWSCSVILDGSLAFPDGPGAPGFRIELQLSIPGRENPIRVAADIPDKTKLAEASDRLAEELGKRLSEEAYSDCWTPEHEGRRFSEEAASALKANRFDEAVAAAEIARVLGVRDASLRKVHLQAATSACVSAQDELYNLQQRRLKPGDCKPEALLHLMESLAVTVSDPAIPFLDTFSGHLHANGLESALLRMSLTFELMAKSNWFHAHAEWDAPLRAAFLRLLDAYLGRWKTEIGAIAVSVDWKKNNINSRAGEYLEYFIHAVPYAALAGTEEALFVRVLEHVEACLPAKPSPSRILGAILAPEESYSKFRMGLGQPVLFWDRMRVRPDAERTMAFGDFLAGHPNPRFRREHLHWQSRRWLSDPDQQELLRRYAELNPRQEVANAPAASQGTPPTESKGKAPPKPVEVPAFSLPKTRVTADVFWGGDASRAPGGLQLGNIDDIRMMGSDLYCLTRYPPDRRPGGTGGTTHRILHLDEEGREKNSWDMEGRLDLGQVVWDATPEFLAYNFGKTVYWKSRGGGGWKLKNHGYTISYLLIHPPNLFLASRGTDAGLIRVRMDDGTQEALFLSSRKPAQTSLDDGATRWAGPIEPLPSGQPAVWVQRQRESASWHAQDGNAWGPIGKAEPGPANSYLLVNKERFPFGIPAAGLREDPLLLRHVPGGYLLVSNLQPDTWVSLLTLKDGYRRLFQGIGASPSKSSLFQGYSFDKATHEYGSNRIEATLFHPDELMVFHLWNNRKGDYFVRAGNLYVSPEGSSAWRRYEVDFPPNEGNRAIVPARMVARRDDLLFFSGEKSTSCERIFRVRRSQLEAK